MMESSKQAIAVLIQTVRCPRQSCLALLGGVLRLAEAWLHAARQLH